MKRSRSVALAMLERFSISDDVLLGAGVASFVDESERAFLDSTRYAGWNALAVSGLCADFAETGDARFLNAGKQIFDALKTRFMHQDGLCAHTQSGDEPYFLEDQAFMMRAGLDLYEIKSAKGDLTFVQDLADRVWVHFADSTGALRDRLPAGGVAVMPTIDRWVPSGNGVTAQVLIRLYKHTRVSRYKDRAEDILTALVGPNIDRIGYAGALTRALALFVHESKKQ